MSYLQLADGTDVNEYYISIPTENGEILRVREDYFDQFNDQQYNAIMNELLATGMLNDAASRKAARDQRRTDRQNKKTTNKSNRQQRTSSFFNKIIDTAKSFIPGANLPTKDVNASLAVTTGNEPAPEPTAWYKNPVVIIGGVALVGLGAYLLLKKKK